MIFGPHPHNLHEGIIYPGIVDAILKAQENNSTMSSVQAIAMEMAEVVQVLRGVAMMLMDGVTPYAS